MRTIFLLGLLCFAYSCTDPDRTPKVPVETADVHRYWEAYDRIVATSDTAEKRHLLRTLFLDPASNGQRRLQEARNYTEDEYLANIASYPKFWASVRENTLRADELGERIAAGVADLQEIYACPQPGHFYFGIGAFRTGGTAVDSFVLIGSESALTDSTVVTDEFPDGVRAFRKAYYATNPIDRAYKLFVHEYVHTQQHPIPGNLLYQCLYEGIAEFVCCLATGEEPDVAVRFGRENRDSVRAVFQQEMFHEGKRSKWLWSNAPNVFEQRDLGYYVGYAMSEGYYEKATDKREAIRTLVELDYTDTAAVDRLIETSGFLSAPLAEFVVPYQADRPSVIGVERQGAVFALTFSEPMDPRWRNFQYGPGGAEKSLRFKEMKGFSPDSLTFTFETEPWPAGADRELIIGSGFRDAGGAGLRPYLIEVD